MSDASRPSVRRGFTFIEILVSLAILSVIVVGVLQMFGMTQRVAVTSESLMNSGVLAQIVSERIKAKIEANPRWLRDLTGGTYPWATTGTVVSPSSAVASGFQLSPFFENLLARADPELCAPANKVSIEAATSATVTGFQPAELASLIQNFRDYEVSVMIDNDVNLELGAPAEYREIVKLVQVKVARSSVVKAYGKDQLAYTATTRVVTPSDSLSSPALKSIYEKFEGPELPDLWTDTFKVAAMNVFMQAPQLGIDSRHVLADAFMVLSGANTESLLTTGLTVPNSDILGQDMEDDPKYIDWWINELKQPDSINNSSAKLELGLLLRRKATVIFDSFRKIKKPLEHLTDAVMGPTAPAPMTETLLQRVRTLQTKLTTDLTAALDFQAKMTQAIADYNATQAKLDSLAATMSTTTTAAGSTGSTTTTSTGGSGTTTSTTGSTTTTSVGGSGTTTSTSSTVATTSTAASGTTSEAMAKLLEEQQKQLAEMATMQAAYDLLLQQAQQSADADTETVVLATFLMQFFNDPAYKPFVERPTLYASRYRATLDETSTVIANHLDMPDTAVTPWQRMRASQHFLEVTTLRQLDYGSNQGQELSRLRKLAKSIKNTQGELGGYLDGGEVHNVAQAKVRYELMDKHLAAMKALCPKFQQTILLLQPGGEIYEFLRLYASMFGDNSKLDAGSVLGDIGDVLDGSSSGSGSGGGGSGNGGGKKK